MSVVAPGCGNGIVEGMEQCDDGNTMNGDSCSSMCMLTVFDCAPGEVPVEIQAMGLPTAIPDGNMTGITNVINVNQMGTVKKVVVTLNITHTYDSDVDIWLDAPAAAELELSTDNGGSGDNYTNTVFAIGGASITGGTAPFTGVFGPEGNFATIVNTAATGAWTLRVADDVTTDAGTLDSWKLNLCVQP
jgi:cysteine-rich repeat protein